MVGAAVLFGRYSVDTFFIIFVPIERYDTTDSLSRIILFSCLCAK